MDNLDVDTFLGEVTGLERDRGMLHMKRVPTSITNS
jgi:hypothetical protein